jgi:hypothetical protein
MSKKTLITLAILLTFPLIGSEVIDRALHISLLPTDATQSEEASKIYQQAMKEVMACNYEKALEIVLIGVEQFPHNFRLQSDFAALLGDHSENFTGTLKERMEQKSKECFDKLMAELEGQETATMYRFKNEYSFRFALHKDQYENAVEMICHYINQNNFSPEIASRGYYYQGVGAAYYAKQLLNENRIQEAQEYAQKSLIAWAQHFSYENDYYNSYVHYALALGILGYKTEMLRALQRSATLIGRDLNYHEFTEVVDFIAKHDNINA